MALLAAFVVVHALADFPLQGEYLAHQKMRSTAEGKAEWLVALAAHSVIHAGGVWLVSGSLVLGSLELVLHGVIDTGKSSGKFGLVTDQTLHLLCKLAYVLMLVANWPV